MKDLHESIPQLTYDIIARLIPGFLMLVVFIWSLMTFNPVSKEFLILGAITLDTSLLEAIVFLTLSYLIGWFFYTSNNSDENDAKQVVYQSLTENQKEIEEKLKIEKNWFKTSRGFIEEEKRDLIFRQMYHIVRIEEPSAGLRLVKLRAEAKMLTTLKTLKWRRALWFILFIAFAVLIINLFIIVDSTKLTKKGELTNIFTSEIFAQIYFWIYAIWAMIKLIPFLILIKFPGEKILESRWTRYWKDVVQHYSLIKKKK